jgi:hypothetical protein
VSNRLFGSGKHAVNTKAISVTADTLKSTLLQMQTAAGKIYPVTAATNASPIVVSVGATTGITAGDILVAGNIAGNLSANGTWQAGTVTGTTVQLLRSLDAQNSTGSGAFSGSGGYLIDLTSATTLTDVSGNSYGTDQSLSGVTDTAGTVNASSWTWTALATSATKVYGMAVYDNTSNNLLAWYDGLYQIRVVTQAAAASTAIAVETLQAIIPSGTVLNFSDGTTATTSAQNALYDTSLAVTSTAAIIHAKATADAGPTLSAGIPFLPNGGNFTFSPDATLKLWTI